MENLWQRKGQGEEGVELAEVLGNAGNSGCAVGAEEESRHALAVEFHDFAAVADDADEEVGTEGLETRMLRIFGTGCSMEELEKFRHVICGGKFSLHGQEEWNVGTMEQWNTGILE